MTNDTTTLHGALAELGELIASNLVAMGVTDAEPSDGLTSLAQKILNITPTLTGVELSTSIDCNSDVQSITSYQNISIEGTLTATYDDIKNTNVDLNGFLQGATVKVYNSNTLLGTAITNALGQYTFTYTPTGNQDLVIHVGFDGTDDYESCQSSNINIHIVIITSLSNANFNDSTLVFTTTALDNNTPVDGASIDILTGTDTNNLSVVDSVITDNNGVATYTYTQQGIGDVYIKAQVNNISSDTCYIDDWVRKGFANIGSWIAFSGRVNTFSSNTDTVFTQGNGSKGGVHSQNSVFYIPNDDYIASFKIANGTIGTGVRIGFHSASYDDHHEKAAIGIENDSSGGFKFDYSNSNVTTVTKLNTNVTKLNTDDLIEFRVVDDTVAFYINGTQYGSATLDWLHTPIWLYAQSWGNNSGNMSITDFKVKKIED